jgi:hypothetical protein
MNYLFIIATLVFFFLFPGVIFILALRFLRKRFKLNYKIIGFLKLKDIIFIYENEEFFMKIQIDYFKVYLVWLRIRFYFRNLNIDYELKSNKINNIPDLIYLEGKKKNLKNEKNPLDETSIIQEIKQKLCEVIKEKYISKHSSKTSEVSDEILEDIIKSSSLSKKETIIRNLMVFFDILMENSLIVYRISNNDFYHSVFIKKILVGAVKGLNKVNLYSLSIKKCILSSKFSKCY